MNIYLSKITTIAITLLISFFTQSISAQGLKDIKKTRDGYIMDNQLYPKKDMKNLFRNTPESMRLHKKAKRQSTVGHISLGLGLASSITGLILMNDVGNPFDISTSRNTLGSSISKGVSKRVGMTLTAIGIGFGTVSLFSYSYSKSNYKRALNEYRLNEFGSIGYNEDEISIETNVSSNGASITYSF